jgi:hypothetical protein
MIQKLRNILGLSPDRPDPTLKNRLERYSPEFSEGFSDRVMKRIQDESQAPARATTAESTQLFEAALAFTFRRVSFAAVTLALALIALDVSKSDNSAILNTIRNDTPEIEEIIADPLFAQVK